MKTIYAFFDSKAGLYLMVISYAIFYFHLLYLLIEILTNVDINLKSPIDDKFEFLFILFFMLGYIISFIRNRHEEPI